ncbi:hypothetical protein MMC17_005939 [Xylographa soralifera]|nr:hypothetical protein [Xylographa soralifera]
MSLSIEEITRILKVLEGDNATVNGLGIDAKQQLVKVIERRNLPLRLLATLIQDPPSVSPWLDLDEEEVVGIYDYPASGLPSSGSSLRKSGLKFASCAIDYIALMFKLLRLDFDNRGLRDVKYDVWKRGLQSPAKELFHLIDMDWDQSEDKMRYHKMPFFDAVIAAVGDPTIQPDSRYEQTLGIGDILSSMAEDLGKALGFNSNGVGICMRCKTCNVIFRNQEHLDNVGVGYCDVEPDAPLENILSNWFGYQRPLAGLKCDSDHELNRCVNMVHEADLPEILFVRLQKSDRRNTPSTPRRCTFVCNRWKRAKQAVTYAWIGSICHPGAQRYKVYWPHDDDATILEYDSIVSEAIQQIPIEGDRDDAIPKEWSCHQELVIMQRIYEKGPSRSQKMFTYSKQYAAQQSEDEFSSTASETSPNADNGATVSGDDDEEDYEPYDPEAPLARFSQSPSPAPRRTHLRSLSGYSESESWPAKRLREL